MNGCIGRLTMKKPLSTFKPLSTSRWAEFRCIAGPTARRLTSGGNMPHYEFFCLDCKKLFSKILSLIDYEEGGVVCPRCRSKNVEQRWSAFTVITSKNHPDRWRHARLRRGD